MSNNWTKQEWEAYFEESRKRNEQLAQQFLERKQKALTVKCPRCKAEPGQFCHWGVTHSGGEVPSSHTPRFRKAGATREQMGHL